jgi:hypothetical protein
MLETIQTTYRERMVFVSTRVSSTFDPSDTTQGGVVMVFDLPCGVPSVFSKGGDMRGSASGPLCTGEN